MTKLVETQRRLVVGLFLLAAALLAIERGGGYFQAFIATIQVVGAIELLWLVWPTPLRPFILPILSIWLATTGSLLCLYRPSLELIGWTLFLGPGYDTSAFVVGRLWGRHRLPNWVSANKTWEGCLGGLIGGTGLSLIYYWQLTSLLGGTWQVHHPVAIAFAANLVALLADLATSWLKRRCHQKDAGLHPLIRATGHGGFVDRFFSPAAAASTLLVYLALFEKFSL